MSKRDISVRRLAVVGLIVHIAFLLLSKPLSRYTAHQVSDRLRRDPEWAAVYESWEADLNFAKLMCGTVVSIYVPLGLVVMIERVSRKSKWSELGEPVSTNLGLLTVIYTLIWLWSMAGWCR